MANVNSILLIIFTVVLSTYAPDSSAQDLHIDTASCAPYTADSSEQQWEAGQLFYTNVIRIADGRSHFIFMDEEYVDSTFFMLDSASREPYYRSARKKINPDELKAHTIVWSLREVQAQQASDGGLYTVVTLTEDTPTKAKPYYVINVKRLYVERIGRVDTLPMYINVNPKTGRITVCSMMGECKSLTAWRRKEFYLN